MPGEHSAGRAVPSPHARQTLYQLLLGDSRVGILFGCCCFPDARAQVSRPSWVYVTAHRWPCSQGWPWTTRQPYLSSAGLFLCSYLVSLSNVFKLLQVTAINVFSLSILRVVILPTRIWALSGLLSPHAQDGAHIYQRSSEGGEWVFLPYLHSSVEPTKYHPPSTT